MKSHFKLAKKRRKKYFLAYLSIVIANNFVENIKVEIFTIISIDNERHEVIGSSRKRKCGREFLGTLGAFFGNIRVMSPGALEIGFFAGVKKHSNAGHFMTLITLDKPEIKNVKYRQRYEYVDSYMCRLCRINSEAFFFCCLLPYKWTQHLICT